MSDHTRYQILFTVPKGQPEPPIENFTADQRREFYDRCLALKIAGVKFTTWDTRNNTLSALFKF